MRYFFSTFFVLLLLIPAVSGFLEHDEAKAKLKAPGFDVAAAGKADYYLAWSEYLKQRVSSLSVPSRVKNYFDYHLFSMTDNDKVYVGRDGWLFASKTVEDARKSACRQKDRARRLMLDLHAANRLVEASGKHLVFCTIPNKATIYPDFVGDIPKDEACGKSFYDLLIEEQDKLPAFVSVYQELVAARKSDRLVYDKTGRSINENGADIVADKIVNTVFRDWPSERALNRQDLSEMVLGNPSHVRKNDSEDGKISHRLTSALVYGGSSTGFLMPSLSRHFDRIDMIVSNTIPSANHYENPTLYDAIIITVPESDLPEIRLDLDRLCAMLSIDAMADTQNKLPLNTISAQRRIEIRKRDTGLTLQSLGADAFFRFPALPGSTSDTLRILKMPLTSPRADVLTWKIDGTSAYQGSRMLRPGKNDIYLPLPLGRSIRLSINPGKYSGIFSLSDTTLLEYAEKTSRHIGAEQANKTVYQKIPPPAEEPDPMADTSTVTFQPTASPETGGPETIALQDFQDGQVFQRRKGSADIFISGAYTGRPEAIEARVQHYNSGEPATPWTVIDSTPQAGVFMGIVPEVPEGGWYRLAVRFQKHNDISDQGDARWGIGVLAVFIGQSNMKEWFHNGHDVTAHSLLSLHKDEVWQQPGSVGGNGAIAFGNRLIGKLAVPVGLLEYAVNGSGLCKEADWGTGYWHDRSENSIYNRFIQGVAAAGGSVEYIIWMQGEADAARGTISENQYRKILQTFIKEQCRQDIVNGSDRPRLPFLIVDMPKRLVGKDEPHQAVHNALRAVAEHIPDCYMAAFSMDLPNLGRQHLAPEAYTTLGLRTAQTVLFLLNEESYYKGPKVTGIYHSGNDTIDATLIHFGGSDFHPAEKISGWQVLDANGINATDDVYRLNPQAIRIRLTRPLQGPATVRYLYGARPDTTHPVKDNSAMELPLEPFEGVLR